MAKKPARPGTKKKAPAPLVAAGGGVDAVTAAIEAGDIDAMVSALEALPAADRRKVAPGVIANCKRWSKGSIQPVRGQPNTRRWAYDSGTDEQRTAAAVCAWLVCTSAELIANRRSVNHHQRESLPALAARVKPPWVNSDDMAAMAEANVLWWHELDALVEAGLCEYVLTDAMVSQLVGGLGFRSSTPLGKVLRERPVLLPQLYRLFEVEGGQQTSLAAADKYRREENTWAHALHDLVDSGVLDRQRVLDATLDGLARDFAAFRAGWFSRFHDRLRPTDAERAARADRYLRLLGSVIPATVSFALKVIEGLSKAGQLTPRTLLDHIVPGLFARQKGTVTRALKLLTAAATREPALAADAAQLAVDALVHEAPDVQAAVLDAVDALRPLCGDAGDDVKQMLADRRDMIAPSLHARLPGHQPAATTRATTATPASTLPTKVQLADPFEASRALQVADDFESALRMVSHALEHPLEADAHELACDAIARHAMPDSADAAKLAGALLKRTARLATHGAGLSMPLALVARAWITGKRPAWPDRKKWPLSDQFVFARLEALAGRAAKRIALPLLSTPTHQGGRIQPDTFSARLDAWRKAKVAPGSFDAFDMTLALYRLPPTARAKAHKALVKLAAPSATVAAALELAATHEPASYEFRVVPRTSGKYTFFHIETTTTPPVPKATHMLLLRHATACRGGYHAESGWRDELRRFGAAAMPYDLDQYFACGVEMFGSWTIDETRAEATGLLPARDPAVELGVPGHWLLLLALASRGQVAIQNALDVAIHGFSAAQGRVTATLLGDALATLLPSGLIKAARLATTLGDLARASDLHAAQVSRTIQHGLRGQTERAPRDIASLLELLHELLAAAGARVDDGAAREWLTLFGRGGKAGALCKKLLAR